MLEDRINAKMQSLATALSSKGDTMPGPYPLSSHTASDGRITITTAQGNHWASTFDPAAAALILSAPNLLSALKNIQDEFIGTPEGDSISALIQPLGNPNHLKGDTPCHQ